MVWSDRRSRRRRTCRGAVLLLALALTAAACASSDGDDSGAAVAAPTSAAAGSQAAVTPGGSAVPLFGIDAAMTWRQLLEAVAGEGELECVDGMLGGELPEGLLEITVIDPVGWPVVITELVGVEVGDDRWPHELWRCLTPRTAAAVHLSVFAQEQGLAEFDLGPDGEACISDLPQNRDFSLTAAQILGSEASFEDGDLAEFMDELDDLAADLVFPCIPALVQEAIVAGIDDFFEGTLSAEQLDCMTSAALEASDREGLDAAVWVRSLSADQEARPDGDAAEQHVKALLAGTEPCLMEGTGQGRNVSDWASRLGETRGTEQRFTLAAGLDTRTFAVEHDSSDDVVVTLHDCDGDSGYVRLADWNEMHAWLDLGSHSSGGDPTRIISVSAADAVLSFVEVHRLGPAPAVCRLESNAVLVDYADEGGVAISFDSDGRAVRDGAFDFYRDLDDYSVELSQGDSVRVWADSADADAFLILFDDGGFVVAEDDDSGPSGSSDSGLNPEVVYDVPASGTYYVVVGYWADTSSTTTGSYRLTVERPQ